jgi:hypothetical protein
MFSNPREKELPVPVLRKCVGEYAHSTVVRVDTALHEGSINLVIAQLVMRWTVVSTYIDIHR